MPTSTQNPKITRAVQQLIFVIMLMHAIILIVH